MQFFFILVAIAHLSADRHFTISRKELTLKYIYLFILVTVIGIPNSVIGQGFTNIKVNHLTTGDQNTDGGNSIAVNGNIVYLLWQDMDSTCFSYVSQSTDGGVTFNNGVKVGGSDPNIFGAITTDNAGSIYVVWDGIVGENFNGVFFAKSVNQATTFSAPLTISAEGVFPQIAVHGSNVYIFFYKPKAGNKVGCFFARSTNGGTTFEVPYEITDASIDEVKWDSPNAMGLDNNGNIYCIWNDGRRVGTGTDVYLAKSTNNGVSFGANIIVNDIAGDANKTRTGPTVAVIGSNVYVAWRQEDDGSGSNRKILFGKSTNGGSLFVAATEIASGGRGSPSLAINSTGEIYIAYPQFTGGKNGLFCTKSNNQGATFPVTVFISDTDSNVKDPSICVDGNDMFYAVWTLAREGNEDDIYFAKGKITVTNIEEEASVIPKQFELMQSYPNPFNPRTTIPFSLPSKSFVSLKVFDALGREMATLVSEELSAGIYSKHWDATSVTSGIYFYRLQAGSFVETRKMLLVR